MSALKCSVNHRNYKVIQELLNTKAKMIEHSACNTILSNNNIITQVLLNAVIEFR